jgi:hypothetical protein
MKEVGLAVSTIDDLRDLKYKISQMDKGHAKYAGHDWAKCPECNRISDLRAQVASYGRKRTAWLAKCRMEDRKALAKHVQRVYNFKKQRGKLENG